MGSDLNERKYSTDARQIVRENNEKEMDCGRQRQLSHKKEGSERVSRQAVLLVKWTVLCDLFPQSLERGFPEH